MGLAGADPGDDGGRARRRVRVRSPTAVRRRSWTGRSAAAGSARWWRAAGIGSGCGATARSAPRCGPRCGAAPPPWPRSRSRGVLRRSGRGVVRRRGARPRRRPVVSVVRAPCGAASGPPAVNSVAGLAAFGGGEQLGRCGPRALDPGRPAPAAPAAVPGSVGPCVTCVGTGPSCGRRRWRGPGSAPPTGPTGPGRRRPTRRYRDRSPRTARAARCARPAARGELDLFAGGRGRGAGAGHHPLLPCRGDLAGQLEGVDAGMVGLQIGPEQLAQQVGEALQRWRSPPRAGVRAGSRPARRAPGGRRSGSGRSAARRSAGPRPENISIAAGASAAQDPVVAQQLVEQRAVGMRLAGGGAHVRGDLQELDAVTDPDRGDRPPLAARMTATRPGPAARSASDPPLRAQPGQRRERRRVPGAGHLGGQPATCRGEAQQPAQTGPDHVGADQHQQTAGSGAAAAPGSP